MQPSTSIDEKKDEALLQRFETVKRALGEHRPLPSHEITLVVITKTCPLSRVRPLLLHEHRHFGENRMQEAQTKWQGVSDEYPDLCLHAVGTLQSNKALQAVRLFDVIHSLDRPRLAYALAAATAKLSKAVSCFVQVNIGDERQKAGVALATLEPFLRLCREECALPVVGLMCLPPHGEMPAPYFALLAKLAARAWSLTAQYGYERRLHRGSRFRSDPCACRFCHYGSAPDNTTLFMRAPPLFFLTERASQEHEPLEVRGRIFSPFFSSISLSLACLIALPLPCLIALPS